ncbi:hypothetical protein Tco_1347592 [Tanacetum coccineum]
MRNKADLDELSMDDLYNNLKVYEAEIKSQSSSSSSSNSQNVAFVSSDDTSSTNEVVNTTHDVPAARAPRNQGNRNGDAPRRIIPVETPANFLVVHDGIGSSSSDSEASTYSKACLKSYESLKEHFDK